MTKNILIFCLLFFALQPQPVFSSTASLSGLATANNSGDNLCNLPAAANFHVTSATSYSVSMAWDAVPGAIGYHVMALDNVSQLVVDDVIVNTTNATLYPPTGSTVDLQVYAICEDQSTSGFYSEISAFDLIITELVVELSAPCEQPDYQQGPFTSGSVYVPWEDGYTYWFDVHEISNRKISRYELQMGLDGPNEEKLTIRKVPELYYTSSAWYSDERAVLFGNSYFSAPAVYNFEKMQVGKVYPELGNYIMPVYWIQFQFPVTYNNQTCLQVTFEQKDANYKVQFPYGSDCTSNLDGDTEDRTQLVFSGEHAPVVVESPFSSSLHIQNIQPEGTSVQFQLLDLGGRPVLDRTYPAGAEFHLPTADLPPGFYLLRIKNGSALQTVKVVKGH